jgi:hypothetical protein
LLGLGNDGLAGLLRLFAGGLALFFEDLLADVGEHLELPDPCHQQGDVSDEGGLLESVSGLAGHGERVSGRALVVREPRGCQLQ